MDLYLTRCILGWCFAVNTGVLLVWALLLIFARDWVYKIHSRWFKISGETFDALHYAGLAFYKILIIFFNLVPWIAIWSITGCCPVK